MSVEQHHKTAVIIKGNPELVSGNPRADAFYNELKVFLESLGFVVVFDPGESHTTPPAALVWIGHSRGADRLRFAPEGTVVIGIGAPQSEEGNNFPVVNHPDDEMAKLVYKNGRVVKNDNKIPDDTYHYVLSDEMKEKIKKILE